jgi:uncharacterized coiled-coil protein SlyX
MDMEKVMECLLAGQEQMVAKLNAKLDVNQEKADIVLAKLDAYQDKVAANRKTEKEEMEADIKAWREEMPAW